MKYSAEDFENAKFAEHPDGRLAVRNCLHTVLPWECSDTYHNDGYMAANGWSPVPTKATITERELEGAVSETLLASCGVHPRRFLAHLGVTVAPDPELPTEPGSVVRTRGDGEDYTLGRDLNWRYGRSVVQPADLRQLDWEVVA